MTGPRSENCPYRGTFATSEFRKISNCSARVVPTETDFNRNGGTFCSHWDEECMGSELMTGFLENNNQSGHPLSRISIAGLDDLGYTVDYSTADTYTVDDLDETCQCTTKPSTRQRQRLHALEPPYRKRLRSAKSMDTSVHQFGLLQNLLSESLSSEEKPSRRQRRRISEEAYHVAMSYGLKILSERRNDQQIQNQFASSMLNEGTVDGSTSAIAAKTTRYVGDQVVSVLVEDNSEIYGVMVVSDDAI